MKAPKLNVEYTREPEWMLLSAGKTVTASSCSPDHPPVHAAEENVQTWWQAASADRSEWLMMDLGNEYDVHAVQINFADAVSIPCSGEIRPGGQSGYIEENDLMTQWKLEGSSDGEHWTVLEDKSDAETDLSHELVVIEDGIPLRYLRLSNICVPYGQSPCISGLRVFGLGKGNIPDVPVFRAVRDDDLDMTVDIKDQPDTLGWNILFGTAPGELYHSRTVFSSGPIRISALVQGNDYYIRVDAFNENGIAHGTCTALKNKEI